MKATRLMRSLVFPMLCVIAFQASAQQTEADRKLFAEFKAKAESGDAEAQAKLASSYALGEDVTSNKVESAKWYRRAAEQGHVKAQLNLAMDYSTGSGVPQDPTEAVKWWRKAAEQGDTTAQFFLGNAYYKGEGVQKDIAAAIELFREAAELGGSDAQYRFGFCYATGNGVPLDTAEAYRWFQKAAKQSQFYTFCILDIGEVYVKGKGVPADYLQAYKWYNLASALGNEFAAKARDLLATKMTPDQVLEAQRLTREFIAGKSPESNPSAPRNEDAGVKPAISGTGFFISEDGFLITNEHVIKNAKQIRLASSSGFISAKVVKLDAANDLALLKADGKFSPLPVATSRTARLGNTVATVGFPNIGLQGFAPKLAKGEIASLSGASDDARYFQISVPVQPGNSGGALVDERGNVVGVVSAKLSARAALATSGALPENVNYAIKSSFLLSFLESVPEVSAKLKEPETKDRKFEAVVKSAEQAAVLVLVY